jgi:hypothetical protein
MLRSCSSARHGTPGAPACLDPKHTSPRLQLVASGARCGILLRDGQIIRPFPLSILSPGFTRVYPWLPVRLLLRHRMDMAETLLRSSARVPIISAEKDESFHRAGQRPSAALSQPSCWTVSSTAWDTTTSTTTKSSSPRWTWLYGSSKGQATRRSEPLPVSPGSGSPRGIARPRMRHHSSGVCRKRRPRWPTRLPDTIWLQLRARQPPACRAPRRGSHPVW